MKNRFPDDPFADREQKKYKHPIPSREYIIKYINQQDKPVNFKKLFACLGLVSEKDTQALKHRLHAMVAAGEISQNRRGRYGALQKMHLIAGKVSAQRQGYGFVLPDDSKMADIYLSPIQMRSVLDGDKVLVYCDKPTRDGKTEGVISEILTRKYSQVTGRVEINEEGIQWLIVDSIKGKPRFVIGDVAKEVKLIQGSVAIGQITTYPEKSQPGTVRVIKILGQYLEPGLEIDTAINAYNIPYEWPEEILKAIKNYPEKVSKVDHENRIDLRDKAFITIDGEDAQDFDDAVLCEQDESGGFVLYVAIADVSYYVKLNTALDEQAKLRGNSVYFPERVVPMLPEILSNNLCSLKPKVDRLALVCQIKISATGELQNYKFYKGIIHSKGRFTYTQVTAMLNKITSNIKITKSQQELFPEIEKLHLLYQQLFLQRQQRGAIDFRSKENQVLFTPQKKIKNIIPVERTIAHRIIEESMLIANLAAANFVIKFKMPALFRNHAPPKEEKLEELRVFLHDFGLIIKGGKNPKSKDYMDCLKKIAKRKDRDSLEMVVLRSLSQACYEAKNIGHFGLAFEQYVHFTSPIRRYADLLVHRLITYKIQNKDIPKSLKDEDKLIELGQQISATEQRATEATRDVLLWLKCEYMQSKLGQVFLGRVTGVTRFGLFVEIEEVFVEGLVHISSLNNDYYIFDKARHSLRGEQTNVQYALGQQLKVIVAGVNVEDRKIDYELSDLNKSVINKQTGPKKEKKKNNSRKKYKGIIKKEDNKPRRRTKNTSKLKRK